MSKASAAVSKDRTIQTFALPYDPVSSPYKKVAFDERVKKFCTETSPTNARVCKIVVVGEVGVGKTSLVNRFCHNAFETDYKATIGVDFEVEKFQVLGIPFNFNMWDTAGQERFHCIAESYFRSSQVIILTFEFGNMKSLERCTFWKESACKCSDDPLIFLVGTKRDLVDDRVYKEFEQDALQVARELNAEYWPTSSKTGLNVKDAFFRIACLTFDKIISQELEAKTTTQPKKAAGSFTMTRHDNNMYEKSKKKKGCC